MAITYDDETRRYAVNKYQKEIEKIEKERMLLMDEVKSLSYRRKILKTLVKRNKQKLEVYDKN